jgi:hypothetical protein
MSSLLEQFIILFDSDADAVKKGADEAEKSTKKLNKELSASAQVSQKLGNSFRNLIQQASGALLSVISAGALIYGIKAAATYADRLDELSKALNVNIEDLSAWGDAVKMTGGTAESFQETAKAMTASLADFATKGKSRAAPFFQELGVAMTDSRGKARDFIEVLPEIADAFQRIGKQEAFGIGQKMGLDQGTIMLLQQGRREVDALIKRQKELGVITKEQGEIAAKFNDQLDDTAHAFRSLFTAAGSFVLPAMTKFLNVFERLAVFMRNNKELVTGALIGIAGALTYFLTPALLSALAAMRPFLVMAGVIGGVVAAVALLYEDFQMFEAGQKSLLGEMVKKWPEVGEAIKNVKEKASQLKQAFIEFTEGNLPQFIKELTTLLRGLGKVLEFVYKLIKGTSDAAKSIKDVITGEAIQSTAALEKQAASTNKLKSVFGNNETTLTAVNKGKQAMAAMSTSPIAAQTSNSVLNNSLRNNTKSTTVNVGEVNVVTQATNGQEVAGAISGSLTQQLRQATSNFDDGVLA